VKDASKILRKTLREMPEELEAKMNKIKPNK
jgi:hypothetical protein